VDVSVAERAFVDAREVRSVVVPEVVRPLGSTLGVEIGVAIVDGRLLAAFDFSGGVPGSSAGLVISEGRGDQVVVLGLDVIATGRFGDDASGDAVAVGDGSVPVLDLGRALRRIEAAAWAAHGPTGLRDAPVSSPEGAT
jgi:hypothetical protein